MYKINGFIYISDGELQHLSKNSPEKLQRLQNNYGEFRDFEKHRVKQIAYNIKGEKVEVVTSPLPNRKSRRQQQYTAPWRDGFQKNNVQHKTQHKTY